MRLATYTAAHPPRLAVVDGDRLIDANRALRTMLATQEPALVHEPLLEALVPSDLVGLLATGGRGRALLDDTVAWVRSHDDPSTLTTSWGEPVMIPLADVQLKAPVLTPPKILCVGLNYRDHAEEQGAKIPRNPILFGKYARSLVGHGEPIGHPSVTEQLDYEAELAVVIGQGGRHIERADALDHVAGYTAMNDVTARDVQFADRQWLRGKMGDTHAPLGPWLVTPDELTNPGELAISLSVNGTELQRSSTDQLIFDIPELISFISRTVTLDPGDVIATGTPGGVGFARDPQVWLHPGDTVRIDLEGVGTLENRVERE